MVTGEGNETLENTLISLERNLDSMESIHFLAKTIASLDTRKREDMIRAVRGVELVPYLAPEGYVIEVFPDGQVSREIPLAVERLADSEDEWTKLDPRSQLYREAVRTRREFDVYFIGRSIEKARDQTYPYAYSDDRRTRVEVNALSWFFLQTLDNTR